MSNVLKSEWKKVHLPVTATILLSTVAALILTSTVHLQYTMWHRLEAWELGTEYFSLLFPVLITLPLGWNLYYERKHNFVSYVLPRISMKKYLQAKWIVHAISAFFIIFVPYMLSAIWALYFINPTITKGVTPEHVFLEQFANTPLLYAAVLSCWKGLIAVLILSLCFVFAMYLENIFVIITGPFVYTVLENFILAILGLEEFRLITSFEPSTLAVSAISIFSQISGPALLCTMILVTKFFLHKMRKMSVTSL